MVSNISINMSSKRRCKQGLTVLMLILADHTQTILIITFRLIAFELIFILSFAFAKLLRFDQSSINVCNLRACD